jgi:2-polyprenyl-6-methoxyphenol hydroxylase-like FAD-dependent oxidoreductase
MVIPFGSFESPIQSKRWPTGIKKALLPVAKPSADVAAAIERIPESQIFERSIVGRSSLSTWRSKGGRVALVGDSAHGMHPNIAQGAANSAFESAETVVETMAAHRNDGDWKAALVDYEKVRKPKADLVQRFANMMGILQATGKEFVSREASAEMVDWIVRNDPDQNPPAEVVEALETFDPLEQPGVSLLW